jgi:MFS family permease
MIQINVNKHADFDVFVFARDWDNFIGWIASAVNTCICYSVLYCCFRFAAVDISPPEFKNKAVTYVLTGGVIAAFLGPTSATYTIHIFPEDYVASFMVMALMGVLNQIAVSLVNFPVARPESSISNIVAEHIGPKRRPIREIISSPIFIVSCSIATIAHTVMVMVMSNCALSMKDDYSFGTTSLVMQFHFFCMFAPGFWTGSLINKHGPFKVAVFGSVVFGMSSLIFSLGVAKWNYFLGMILLGLGWNFSFSAGTVMLTQSYAVRTVLLIYAISFVHLY